jgi:hypothetical protein
MRLAHCRSGRRINAGLLSRRMRLGARTVRPVAECLDHAQRRQAGVDFDVQRLVIEISNDIERTEASPKSEAVGHEFLWPRVIRRRWHFDRLARSRLSLSWQSARLVCVRPSLRNVARANSGGNRQQRLIRFAANGAYTKASWIGAH